MANKCNNNSLTYFLFLLNKQNILPHHVRCIYCTHRQFRHIYTVILIRYFSYKNHLWEFIHIKIISYSYENYVKQNSLCMWHASRNINGSIKKWRFILTFYLGWYHLFKMIGYYQFKMIEKYLFKISGYQLFQMNEWLKSHKWYHLLLKYCRYGVKHYPINRS